MASVKSQEKSAPNKGHYVKLGNSRASSRNVDHSNEYKFLRIRAYLVIIGGFLVLNSVGGMYAFGNIVPYLSSYWTYIHFNKDVPYCQDKSSSNPAICDEIADKYKSFTDLSVWTYTSLLIFWCGFGFLGGYFELYFGPRKACLFGATVAATAISATYFTCSNFYFTTCTFGALLGACNALAYTPPIVAVIRWWPNNRALASSIILLGCSVGAVWIDYIETLFINTNNAKEDQTYGFICDSDIMRRFPFVFLLLGVTMFIVMGIGGSLMANPPKYYLDVLNDHKKMQQQQQQQLQQKQNSIQRIKTRESLDHIDIVASNVATPTTPTIAETILNRNIVQALVTHLQNSNAGSIPSSGQASSAPTSDRASTCPSCTNTSPGISDERSPLESGNDDRKSNADDGIDVENSEETCRFDQSTQSVVSVDGMSSVMGIGNEYDLNSNIGKSSNLFENGANSSLLISMNSQSLNVSKMSSQWTQQKNKNSGSLVLTRSKVEFIDNSDETNQIVPIPPRSNSQECQVEESYSDERMDVVLDLENTEQDKQRQQTKSKNKNQKKGSKTEKRKKMSENSLKYCKVTIPTTREEIVEFLDKDMAVFAYTTKEAFSSFKFYQLCLIDFLNVIIITFVVSEWKIFANNYLNIENDGFLVLLGSCSSIFNAVGRIAFAFLFDYSKSFKISMASITFIMALFVSTICVSDLWYSEELLFVWICILSACAGGNYAMYASAVSQAFGIKNSGVILGFVFVAELPSVAGEAFLFDNITGIVGSWLNLSIIMGVGAGISTILALTFSTQNSKKIQFLKTNNVSF